MYLLSTLMARDGDEPASDVSELEGHDDIPGAPRDSPAVAFIIGVSIVLLASILNAGGLNLTKLDHVRTSAIPKASRRKDWLRPLWLLGMILYILSQLIGSTLALRYLRAEYVAPLGATSLIFNFLFASLLVGTPVTNTDIYGTIVVILGVIGIVAFGSINSGLENGMDPDLLKSLWGRPHWLLLFIIMTIVLSLVYIFASQLERVLTARGDISAVPFAAQAQFQSQSLATRGDTALGRGAWWNWRRMKLKWGGMMSWVAERLETWTAAKDDKTLAWTLGIAWACCGGGLAGGCLVFARTSVQLISYAVDPQQQQTFSKSQLLHISVISTFTLLLLTAILQIICLNRGLRVYDSTLVVPVFYGVYTGTGALDALVFNNEIERYHSWTLVLIFVSICVLVCGVVLLTHKKPEPGAGRAGSSSGGGGGVNGHVSPLSSIPALKKRRTKGGKVGHGETESSPLRGNGDGDLETGNDPVLWQVGDVSDDDGDDATVHDHNHDGSRPSPSRISKDDVDDDGDDKNRTTKRGLAGSTPGEEGRGLMRRGSRSDHDNDNDNDNEDW